MTEPHSGLPPLRDVIAQHRLSARKSLGQHFLLDGNLTRRIARAAGDLAPGTVIEIGPGPGGLTRALLETGAGHVIAVEKDERCLEALSGLVAAYPDRLELLAGDAMALDPSDLGTPPRRIASNLPYNIATALLIRWLGKVADNPSVIESFTLMFQKEVAARLVATPRSKEYGRLSVITQWLAEVRLLFDVAPTAFTPPPQVTSTVVQIRPRRAPLYPAPKDDLERVTAAAFGQRRKMLRQSLKTLGLDPAPLIDTAEVPPTARAEELEVADFCALARALVERKRARPRP